MAGSRCYPCEVRVVHLFHDDGHIADSIMCEDIGGGWSQMALLARREELCGNCAVEAFASAQPSKYGGGNMSRGDDEPEIVRGMGDGPRLKRPGDPRFHYELARLGDLHDKKQIDYGTDNDPFANVRGSADWGIPPWVGAMVRANDKVKRLQNFARKGSLANESAEDSFDDLAVYAMIGKVLYREESGFDYAAVIPLGPEMIDV